MRTHTHVRMFIFGLCCTLVIQTLGRLSYDGLTHAPLFRYCGMYIVIVFTQAFGALWMWQIVCPRELRKVKLRYKVLLCFLPLIFPLIMSGVYAPIPVEDAYDGSASNGFKNWSVVYTAALVVVLWICAYELLV